MSIKRPNHEQLATIIKNLGMSMDANEVNFFLENLQGGFRYLERNNKDDVASYMESFADLIKNR